LWQALAASLALHLLLALFLPVWTAQASGGLQPIEAISFAHIARVQIQRPARASLPAAVPHTRRHSASVALARTRAELTAKSRKPHAMPSADAAPRGQATAASAPRYIASKSHALYARPVASADVSSVQQAQAAPSPQPETTQAAHTVSGAGGSDRGGVLPLGATQDPVLDPGVREALQKRVGVHVTLIVTVGEDGRTKHVEFQPPLDAETERAVEALLADATWDAAVCGGGVSCEGVATIRL
jgi:hypothetical protein